MPGGSPTPSVAGTVIGDGSVLAQNKNVRIAARCDCTDDEQTIRKVLSRLLVQMGVDRQADDFEPIFQMARSGVAFALVRQAHVSWSC